MTIQHIATFLIFALPTIVSTIFDYDRCFYLNSSHLNFKYINYFLQNCNSTEYDNFYSNFTNFSLKINSKNFDKLISLTIDSTIAKIKFEYDNEQNGFKRLNDNPQKRADDETLKYYVTKEITKSSLIEHDYDMVLSTYRVNYDEYSQALDYAVNEVATKEYVTDLLNNFTKTFNLKRVINNCELELECDKTWQPYYKNLLVIGLVGRYVRDVDVFNMIFTKVEETRSDSDRMEKKQIDYAMVDFGFNNNYVSAKQENLLLERYRKIKSNHLNKKYTLKHMNVVSKLYEEINVDSMDKNDENYIKKLSLKTAYSTTLIMLHDIYKRL